MNKKSLYIILLHILIGATYLLVMMNKLTFLTITKEDNIVENLGAGFFCGASIIFFYLFYKSKDNGNKLLSIRTKRNYFYLFMGIIFFYAFGEEISWGQRIFGWGSPEFVQKYNIQDETNIHNMKFIENDLIDSNKIFVVFWGSYCLVVPLLNRFSNAMKHFFSTINLPMSPLWIGTLFLVAYFGVHVAKLPYLGQSKYICASLDEIKETDYALIFFFLSSVFLINKTSIKSE